MIYDNGTFAMVTVNVDDTETRINRSKADFYANEPAIVAGIY